MKYSLNHPWKFRDFKAAFIVGFLQAVMAIIVECATYLVLVFASPTVFKVLENYIIVLVIADFDENFYSINSDVRNKQKITEERYEKIRKVEVTTSWSADHKVDGNRLENEQILSREEAGKRPEYIYMSFSSRSCSNKVLYSLYRFVMLFYNSIFYYFSPFIFRYFTYFYFIYKNSHLTPEERHAAPESGHH